MTGMVVELDLPHVIPCHSPAHHPARPRLARPHPVLWHHPLEVLPRRGLPHAGSRGPAMRGGVSHGQARK